MNIIEFLKSKGWRFYLLSIVLAFVTFFIIISAWFFISLPDVSYLEKENPPITALMQQRIDEAAEKGKKLKIKQSWISFKNIPELLKKAVRISEDASFYFHEGVDFEELKEAFKKNWEKGEIARGGSTITQQLAKNLYLSTDKSYWRKIKEYFIAKRLEEQLPKNRIFHLYLNLIEFGPGVFGVQAASRRYFGQNVATLDLEKIIRLVSVIPRPLNTRPTSNSGWLKWRGRWILGKLKQYSYIESDLYEETIPAFQKQ